VTGLETENCSFGLAELGLGLGLALLVLVLQFRSPILGLVYYYRRPFVAHCGPLAKRSGLLGA